MDKTVWQGVRYLLAAFWPLGEAVILGHMTLNSMVVVNILSHSARLAGFSVDQTQTNKLDQIGDELSEEDRRIAKALADGKSMPDVSRMLGQHLSTQAQESAQSTLEFLVSQPRAKQPADSVVVAAHERSRGEIPVDADDSTSMARATLSRHTHGRSRMP